MSKVTARRKDEHIRINLEESVQFPHLTTGLERFHFMHRALPELDFQTVDTSLELFGKRLKLPLLISSMTGGTDRAQTINLRLAELAQNHQIAMGVGSQRAAIEDPALAATFQVRHIAPDILLFANLGAVQLNYKYGLAECQKAVEMIGADALILHFNALQEAVQPEGDTNFAGLVEKVANVTAKLGVPVIAKEVGWGFSPEDVKLLASAGVAAIDVAGAGGTSWSEVEYHRAPTAFHAQVARSFADWGIPTAQAIQYVHESDLTIIASGGLRDGIDIAKTVALGAKLGGIASSFLKAADESPEKLDELARIIHQQFKITMFCTGAKNIQELGETELLQR